MSDLIDRDFAIKALSGAADTCNDYRETYGIERAQDIISCLPSAQPVDKDINVPVNDCISRASAIDALNKLDVSDGVGISSVACDLQEEAIRSINNLPSAQPQWVLRSEKLPEERTKVLATVLVPHRESIVISAEYLMSTFYCDNGDCWMADDEEVVAWMSLPQPYKGGHDDN